jgi:catechol 2,3-dioxygenase-like lactoylglutathione lyase family enzyme
MTRIQTQGVHHITLMGADRQTSIDFWQGVLGMPLVFEQPNLDASDQNHLYFDPGDGRLITIFTSESWQAVGAPNPTLTGNVHHIAFAVSRATYTQAVKRLKERRLPSSGEIDRGFMDSIYFREPLGHLIELAAYKFEPPAGFTHADVLREAHNIRVAAGAYNIADEHLADAIALLSRKPAPADQIARKTMDS